MYNLEDLKLDIIYSVFNIHWKKTWITIILWLKTYLIFNVKYYFVSEAWNLFFTIIKFGLVLQQIFLYVTDFNSRRFQNYYSILNINFFLVHVIQFPTEADFI
jgi:hypothetical protein